MIMFGVVMNLFMILGEIDLFLEWDVFLDNFLISDCVYVVFLWYVVEDCLIN